MISLSYVSCSKRRFNDDELSELLKHCHKYNAKSDITGLLLYNGLGTFIQTLEGEEGAVTTLFDQIKKDPRHHRVNCIGQRTIKTRAFPNWKMGFRKLSTTSDVSLEGYSDFMNDQDSTEYLNNNTNFAHAMVAHFKNQTNELHF